MVHEQLYGLRGQRGDQPAEKLRRERLQRRAPDGRDEIVDGVYAPQNGRPVQTQKRDHQRRRQEPKVQSNHRPYDGQVEHGRQVDPHEHEHVAIRVNAGQQVRQYPQCVHSVRDPKIGTKISHAVQVTDIHDRSHAIT